MWLILLILVFFLILDRLKIMQYNTLLMSMLYILGIPALLAAYSDLLLYDILRMAGNYKTSYLISLIVNLLFAIPIIILLCYILFKMCRSPIARERFSGDDTQYIIACANRQKALIWLCFPLIWIPYIGGLGAAFTTMMHSAAVAWIALNPLAWVINILCLGMLIPMLLVTQAYLIGAELVFCLMFFTVYAIYLIITLAMTSTLLFRVRSFSGYSKKKNILIVISMAIPLWGMISVFQISRMISRISKNNT